jgi:hypothetical protein
MPKNSGRRQPNVDPIGIDPDEIDYYSEVIQF